MTKILAADEAVEAARLADADHGLVTNEGRGVEEGTCQQLLDRRGFCHYLYVSPFKGRWV